MKVNVIENILQELELVSQVYSHFNKKKFLNRIATPVFFGTALQDFGIDHILESLVNWAPSPVFRLSDKRKVSPEEKNFTGFVFKIQANMDLKHRDRIAFIRIVSGQYRKGMKLRNTRTKQTILSSNAFSFLAGERRLIKKAYPGDIIGIHNHRNIKIGDTLTQGEKLQFLGIPYFAPEVFRQIILNDPFKYKQLKKGLFQLSEEGAIQVFHPINNNFLILGAIGVLQFDVVIERLKVEYHIHAIYKKIDIVLARWIASKNHSNMTRFIRENNAYLAYDNMKCLTYLAPNQANFNIVIKNNPDIIFNKIRK